MDKTNEEEMKELTRQIKEKTTDSDKPVDPKELTGECITAVMVDRDGHYATISAVVETEEGIDNLPNRKNFLKIFKGSKVEDTTKQANEWITVQTKR